MKAPLNLLLLIGIMGVSFVKVAEAGVDWATVNEKAEELKEFCKSSMENLKELVTKEGLEVGKSISDEIDGVLMEGTQILVPLFVAVKTETLTDELVENTLPLVLEHLESLKDTTSEYLSQLSSSTQDEVQEILLTQKLTIERLFGELVEVLVKSIK